MATVSKTVTFGYLISWWVSCSKSCCLRIGPRCEIPAAGVNSLPGQSLPWVNEMRYLDIYIVRSWSLKCSLDACRKEFYRAANSIFGKIERTASEEVVLQLISTKCLPVLLYGLDAFSLYIYQLQSLDFVIDRFFMKLFRTLNIHVVSDCQEQIGFVLTSVQLARRAENLWTNCTLVYLNLFSVFLCYSFWWIKDLYKVYIICYWLIQSICTWIQY